MFYSEFLAVAKPAIGEDVEYLRILGQTTALL